MFLSDKELDVLLTQLPNLIEGLDRTRPLTDKRSPIQPASVDLTIGAIFVPGTTSSVVGGIDKPKSEHVLEVGGTAIVTTAETLNLPPTLGAIGFPPTSVSSRGLIMTDPGHVDPGFLGQLRFTIMNMSGESVSLHAGLRVATLLFFKLGNDPAADWTARYGSRGTAVGEELLEHLSPDFMNVGARAKEASDATVREIRDDLNKRTALIGLLGSVIVAFIVFLGNVFPAFNNIDDRLDDLTNRLDVFDSARNVELLQNRIETLEVELNQLKKAQEVGTNQP